MGVATKQRTPRRLKKLSGVVKANGNVSNEKSTVFAIVRATPEHLKEIGIDEPLTNMVLLIKDKDCSVGIGGILSRVEFIKKYGNDYEFKNEYLIATKYLEFLPEQLKTVSEPA